MLTSIHPTISFETLPRDSRHTRKLGRLWTLRICWSVFSATDRLLDWISFASTRRKIFQPSSGRSSMLYVWHQPEPSLPATTTRQFTIGPEPTCDDLLLKVAERTRQVELSDNHFAYHNMSSCSLVESFPRWQTDYQRSGLLHPDQVRPNMLIPTHSISPVDSGSYWHERAMSSGLLQRSLDEASVEAILRGLSL